MMIQLIFLLGIEVPIVAWVLKYEVDFTVVLNIISAIALFCSLVLVMYIVFVNKDWLEKKVNDDF